MIQKLNPFQHLYDQCNAGDSKQKYAELPNFPRLIDIEPTNSCNFRCLMCPTGNLSLQRKSGFMDMDVYRNIVQQLAPYQTALRFIQWGEPLLHPNIIEMVQLAHEQDLLTHLNTNGSKLDIPMMEELIDAGLDSLKFSFQGVDRQSYKEMRGTDFFEGLMETVERFFIHRGDRTRPFLHVSTSITYEDEETVEKFKDRIEKYVDKVSVGRTVLEFVDLDTVRLRPHELELLEELKEKESVVKVHPECPEVYDKLSINWDGTITACCSDADNLMLLGDVQNTKLIDIWNSEKLNYYRTMLSEMRHDELPVCKSCYDYQSLADPNAQNL
jgi:radical SAM protein with 4Fe4S-binding SPASM domain